MRFDLIALALIERLIRAPWPVHFQMVLGQRRRDVLELADDPPQSVARLAPGGRLSPLVRAVRAAKKIRRRASSPRRAPGGRARHHAVTVGATKAVELYKVMRATMGPSVMKPEPSTVAMPKRFNSVMNSRRRS
jgi:hypothetical protein